MAKKPKKKKQRYLTVNVKPAKRLKHTVQVSIPPEFFYAEGLPDVVRSAITTVQDRMLKITGEQH